MITITKKTETKQTDAKVLHLASTDSNSIGGSVDAIALDEATARSDMPSAALVNFVSVAESCEAINLYPPTFDDDAYRYADSVAQYELDLAEEQVRIALVQAEWEKVNDEICAEATALTNSFLSQKYPRWCNRTSDEFDEDLYNYRFKLEYPSIRTTVREAYVDMVHENADDRYCDMGDLYGDLYRKAYDDFELAFNNQDFSEIDYEYWENSFYNKWAKSTRCK
jgi:hypothetical protein